MSVNFRSFRAMNEWDKRDDPVLLLIDYREDGEFSLGDAYLSVTVGHNSDHNVPADEAQGWQFAGWDNSHECYTQGKGLAIGWMPLPNVTLGSQWRWWAGRNGDEYRLAGPCLTREAAISEAYGHTEPGDTIYLVEAIADQWEDGDGIRAFTETRNHSEVVREEDAKGSFVAVPQWCPMCQSMDIREQSETGGRSRFYCAECRASIRPAAEGSFVEGLEAAAKAVKTVACRSIDDGRKWFGHPAANEAFEVAVAAIRALTPAIGEGGA